MENGKEKKEINLPILPISNRSYLKNFPLKIKNRPSKGGRFCFYTITVSFGITSFLNTTVPSNTSTKTGLVLSMVPLSNFLLN